MQKRLGVHQRCVAILVSAKKLFIHGSGPGVSAWANWRLTIPELVKNNRVIAPDMIGFGLSERPENHHYSMDNWVAHATGLLYAVKLGRVSVIGNSFSGALALGLVIRYPKRIKTNITFAGVDKDGNKQTIRH